VSLVVALSALTGLAAVAESLFCCRYRATRHDHYWHTRHGRFGLRGLRRRKDRIRHRLHGRRGGGRTACTALAALSTELFPHSSRATAAGWIVVAGVVGAIVGLIIFGVVGDSVHVTGAGSLRLLRC